MSKRRRLTLVAGVAGVALAVLVAAAPAFAATPAPATSSVPTTSPALLTTTLAPTTTSAPTTTPLKDPFAPVTVAAPRAAATATVSIVDFGFSPATVTVAAGSTVTWTNTGSVIHSVTSDTGAFDSSPGCPTGPCIDPGASYSHVFAQAGRFAYHCRVHSNMTGTVVVTAAATTTTASPDRTTPGSGNPPVSAGAAPSTAPGGTGNDVAFTGASGRELWFAFGALAAITLGLFLRPRRRSFPTQP